jgi:putative transposase
MAEFQLSIDEQAGQGLFQGDAGSAKFLEQVLNQVLEAQVSEQLGAERYERTAERQGYRNGGASAASHHAVGQVDVARAPGARPTVLTEFFAGYQRSEQALALALMERVVNELSTH